VVYILHSKLISEVLYGITQYYIPTQLNVPCLNPSPGKQVLNISTPEGWKAKWMKVAGYISRWFTCLQTVTHPSTKPARHKATLLIWHMHYCFALSPTQHCCYSGLVVMLMWYYYDWCGMSVCRHWRSILSMTSMMWWSPLSHLHMFRHRSVALCQVRLLLMTRSVCCCRCCC